MSGNKEVLRNRLQDAAVVLKEHQCWHSQSGDVIQCDSCEMYYHPSCYKKATGLQTIRTGTANRQFRTKCSVCRKASSKPIRLPVSKPSSPLPVSLRASSPSVSSGQVGAGRRASGRLEAAPVSEYKKPSKARPRGATRRTRVVTPPLRLSCASSSNNYDILSSAQLRLIEQEQR